MDGINIVTTDKRFGSDLKAEKIEDLGIAYKQRFINTIPAESNQAIDVVNIVIYLSTSVGSGLFANWLYDRLKNKKTDQITINGNVITSENIEQIPIIINNHIITITNNNKE